MQRDNGKSLTEVIIEGIQERKGRNISVIDLSGRNFGTTSSFIICEGTSTSHVASVADSVRDYVLEHASRKPYAYDGYRNCQWIVLDYGEAVVHIFLPEERLRYNLEELWGDAPIRKIEDIY